MHCKKYGRNQKQDLERNINKKDEYKKNHRYTLSTSFSWLGAV